MFAAHEQFFAQSKASAASQYSRYGWMFFRPRPSVDRLYRVFAGIIMPAGGIVRIN